MRISSLLLSFVLSALFLIPCAAQQPSSPPSPPPERDAQAVSILQAAVTAAGGPQSVRAIKDFTASGTITHYWAGQMVSGLVEIRGRGVDQVRMDSRLDGGLYSIVLNHGAGKTTSPDSTRNISVLNGLHLGLLILPLRNLVAQIDDSLTGFSLKGTEQIGGSAAHKLQVTRRIPGTFHQVGGLKNLMASEVFIDSTNLMIVGIRHPYLAKESRALAVIREVCFSDFRQVNGVAVAFTINEKNAGQLTSTIKLSKIEFNLGVAEDIFRQ